MAIYDFNGNPLVLSNDIYIKDIKEEYPSYNDDQLLDAAISSAKNIGASSHIIWDGTDIHFSGSVTHECKGFGGIDFNGSKIYMPNYDNGVIISIVPDVSDEITLSGTVLERTKVTNDVLKNKVFSVFGNNPGLCLGTRQGFGTTQNWRPTLKTSQDGYYETGNLFLIPTSANILFSNVHQYPAVTFILRNATIVSYNSANMSTFVSCKRSNTRISDFVLEGRSQVNTYHDGVFSCASCVDIEVCHISGINPITESLTSGYFLGISCVTNAYVHDCYVGDNSHVYNTAFEQYVELGNLLQISHAIVQGALARKESRGGHSRRDFPKRDDANFLKHTLIFKDKETGKYRAEYKDVVITKYQPKERKY